MIDLGEVVRRVSTYTSHKDFEGSIRFNDEWISIPKNSLAEWLMKLPKALGKVVAVDTEASGLYADGKWSSTLSECQPKARCSIVSVSYRADTPFGEYVTFAVPFDQGVIGGKCSTWNYDKGEWNLFDHIDGCKVDAGHCTCAPMNFGEFAWRAMVGWLAAHWLVFHNAKYDLHVFREGLRLFAGTGVDLEASFHWDTLLVQAVYMPLSKNSLDAVARELFDEGKDDTMSVHLKKNGTGLTKRYDLVPWEVAGIYAAQDAKLTIKLFYDQQVAWNDGTIDHIDQAIIDKEFKKMVLLYRMENRGVAYDVDTMRVEAEKMAQWVIELEQELPWVKLGQPPNITGAKWWFFTHLDTPPFKLGNSCQVCGFNAKTGKRRKKKVPQCPAGQCLNAPSLDAEVVGRYVEDGIEGAELWQAIGNMRSALSKWYLAWPNQIGDDGRLRTNYRQCHMESDRKDQRAGGAISNRLSAERVQFQGFPKDRKLPENIKPPKKMIRAAEGKAVWEIDVSNAEIRVAAWASKDPNLTEAVNSGKNIHDMNTSFIFGETMRAGDFVGELEDHPDWDMYRDLSKIGVFSDFYGSGVRTMLAQFQSGLKRSFPQRFVTDFKENLAKAYPLVKVASRKAQRKADVTMGGCGYIRLYNGRRRWFGALERTHKAWNQVMQCNVAEAVSEWMLAIEDKYPGILINQVHDSDWLEVDDSPEGEAVVDDCMAMGVAIFEKAFTGIKFKIDKKRLA